MMTEKTPSEKAFNRSVSLFADSSKYLKDDHQRRMPD
jgi:hypothetical protein